MPRPKNQQMGAGTPSFLRVFVFVVTIIATISVMNLSKSSDNLQTTAAAGATTTAGYSIFEVVPRSLFSENILGENPTTTITAPATVNPGKYPPFSCPQLLDDLKHNEAIQALDPNLGRVYARRTTNDVPFYVSMHNSTFDSTRWGIMKYGFYYERKVTEAFEKVLKVSPSGARVLDVGGNIGVFSLTSASLGPFVIDTFEPNIKNRMRYCESLSLNRWFQTEFDANIDVTKPRVNPYSFGIGEEEGSFGFRERKNPGMGAVTKKPNESDPNAIQVIRLDNFAQERGWFQSRPHIAILKIDVEGFEHRVIEGAKELLRSKLARNIFMEITVEIPVQRQRCRRFLRFLTHDAGYVLYKVGGWRGPEGKILNWPNDDKVVDKIIEIAQKEDAKQLNLWWKLPNDEGAPAAS